MPIKMARWATPAELITMNRRFLFGPVTADFARQNLHDSREQQTCLTFGPDEGGGIVARPRATWESIQGQLPGDWRPDFVVLYLPYTTIPESLWSAPVPIIGLAADWNLLWHQLRWQLPRCDLALTDVAGVEALRKAGIDRVRAASRLVVS
jgi:hypothetical protein